MGGNQALARAACASIALLIAALFCGVCCITSISPAYADLVVGTQDTRGLTRIEAANVILCQDAAKTIPISSLTYTGNEIKPHVKVKIGDAVLSENTHYTVEFPDNNYTDIGVKTIRIKGVGSAGYTTDSGNGGVDVTYQITKLNLSSSPITATYAFGSENPVMVPTTSLYYTGNDMRPSSVKLTVNGNEINSSLYSFGDFSGSKAEASGEWIETGNDYQAVIKPRYIDDNGSYTDDSNKRKSGNISYEGEFTKTLTFKIEKLNICSNTLLTYQIGSSDPESQQSPYSSISSRAFSGSDLKPKVVALKTTNGLAVNEKLYSVSYSGADVDPSGAWINAGSYSIVLAPTYIDSDGNYTSNENDAQNSDNVIYNDTFKKTVSLTVDSASLSTLNQQGSISYNPLAPQAYTGSQITPNVSGLKYGSYSLIEGKDYTKSYGTNINAGSGSVTITGKGNFASSINVPFTINAKEISSADISISGVSSSYDYTGSAITPAIVVRDNGKTLEADSYNGGYATYGYFSPSSAGYYAEYSDNTNPGVASITITGVGNYTGTRMMQFNINSTGNEPRVKAVDLGDGQVVLQWGPVYGATKFMIQEKMPDGRLKTLSDEWASTKCRITNLSTTRNHRFLVRALVNGVWSSDSDALLVSIKPSGVKRPVLRAFSAAKSGVTLAWAPVPGAEYYAIYRKVGKKFRALTTSYTSTAATITKLKKKGKYTFYVLANVDGKWTSAKKANRVTVSPADPNPPEVTAVAGVGVGNIKLSWSKALNAKKYMVQVQMQNGKWKTLTKKCKKCSYLVKGLSPARSHTFRVRAYGNKKWSKAYSDFNVSATPDNA